MTKPTENSRSFKVRALPQNQPTSFEVRPDKAELTRIAADLDLIDLRKVLLTGEIKAAGQSDWTLTARLGATVIQSCVVTLDPVTTRIEHRLDEPAADAWVVQTPHAHCHYTLGKMPISESSGVVVPFWIVKTTSNEADANLKVCMHKCKGGIQIPVLKNSVAVDADTKLMLYKPREVKADVIVMARADAGEDAPELTPKAKAKPKRAASCSAPAPKRAKK